jgi:hypothetical protein
MATKEYICIWFSDILKEITNALGWDDFIDEKGYIYFECSGGMYGLLQAGKLVNDQLEDFLKPFSFASTKHTAGLWKHESQDLHFSLIVDNFGIKHTNHADVDFFISTLQEQYTISINWTRNCYSGLTLDWDYETQMCNISMPGYVERALQCFQHLEPK